MKKFLVVGCGGSGGATLRYMIDQLKADLRPYGITELPAAWQFLHIDVPPSPEETKGLGTIRELGGRYLSVSSPGNNYQLVATRVEQAMAAKGALRELLGWAPAPKESVSVDVTKGAGQYRAVGRVLTLTDLGDILNELNRTWEQLQRPDAWGELPAKHPQGGPYETTADVIPLVVGSMAGGSGASMFLDVCRALGRLSGLNRTGLGVFLYTADVFASLPASQRAGVDGNALGALGEVIAAQTRASDAADAQVFEALGVPLSRSTSRLSPGCSRSVLRSAGTAQSSATARRMVSTAAWGARSPRQCRLSRRPSSTSSRRSRTPTRSR